MQLLQEFSPLALLFMTIFVPIFEPVGWVDRPETILGFEWSIGAAIVRLPRAPLIRPLFVCATWRSAAPPAAMRAMLAPCPRQKHQGL